MLGVLSSATLNYENKWTINYNHFNKIDEKIVSPIISLSTKNLIDTKWQLWMKRDETQLLNCYNRVYYDRNLVIYLENLNDFDVKAKVTIVILNDKFKVFKEHCLPIHLFTASKKCIPTEKIIKIPYDEWGKIDSSLLSDNSITIGYKINIDYSKIIIDENKFCRLEHLNKLEELFMNKESSDLIIKASEKEFYVHKCILETFSPVFKTMFQHDFLEKKKNIVEVVDIKPEVFEEFLRFFYTGKVNEIDKIEQELLYAAEKYLVQGLKLLCEDNILKKISLENAVEYLELAIKSNANNLKNKVIEFISLNFKELCKNQELKSLRLLEPDILYNIMNGIADYM